MTKQFDGIWYNGLAATCELDNSLIDRAAIAVKGGRISWIGPAADLPAAPAVLADNIYDLQGRLVTPGFIDCHTHLIYAGNRAQEFEQRLQGVTYEAIARRGGGIQSTVTATRAASVDELYRQSLKRARALMASGVTTMEIKTGYGLEWDTELKMLRVARMIQDTLPVTIKKTFLAAHTVPREYQGRADEYVRLICEKMIPQVAEENLADAVDVFCEKIAFTLEQTSQVFRAAKKHGLDVKCHAEQLSDSGSAALAAKYHALSADHLEHVSEDSVKAMAKSGTVAVLLPGAFYFLRETKLPPIELLREHGVPMAIASDSNPGTSPVMSLLLMLNMACTLFRLTPQEALAGVTRNAAQALGMHETHGTLTVGKAADFCVWDVQHPVELVYSIGGLPLRQMIKEGILFDAIPRAEA